MGEELRIIDEYGNNNNPRRQYRNAEEVILHEGYDYITKLNDIAIIIIDRPFVLTH